MLEILAIWGCLPEITNDCIDMTNSSSTYLSILVGAIIGLAITWWIYNRQKKISDKQDVGQRHIKDLEESHERILKSIEGFQKHQERILNQILSLDKKIDCAIENNDT